MTATPEETAAASPAAPVDITIILPCLDEASAIASVVEEGRTFLEQEGLRGEILVVDNGSSDGTAERAREAGAEVVSEPVRGLGAACRAGLARASGARIVIADGDGSYDLTALKPFLQALDDGADLVLGQRFKGGIEDGAMPWLHRYVGNPLLTWQARRLFGVPVGDVHCGLKALRRGLLDRLRLRTTGMEFASELVIQAQLRGATLAEVPTPLRRDRRAGAPPKLRRWRDGLRHLRWRLSLVPGLWLGLPSRVASLAAVPFALSLASEPEDPTTRLGPALALLLTSTGLAMLRDFVEEFGPRAALEGGIPEAPATDSGDATHTLVLSLLGLASLAAKPAGLPDPAGILLSGLAGPWLLAAALLHAVARLTRDALRLGARMARE